MAVIRNDNGTYDIPELNLNNVPENLIPSTLISNTTSPEAQALKAGLAAQPDQRLALNDTPWVPEQNQNNYVPAPQSNGPAGSGGGPSVMNQGMGGETVGIPSGGAGSAAPPKYMDHAATPENPTPAPVVVPKKEDQPVHPSELTQAPAATAATAETADHDNPALQQALDAAGRGSRGVTIKAHIGTGASQYQSEDVGAKPEETDAMGNVIKKQKIDEKTGLPVYEKVRDIDIGEEIPNPNKGKALLDPVTHKPVINPADGKPVIDHRDRILSPNQDANQDRLEPVRDKHGNITEWQKVPVYENNAANYASGKALERAAVADESTLKDQIAERQAQYLREQAAHENAYRQELLGLLAKLGEKPEGPSIGARLRQAGGGMALIAGQAYPHQNYIQDEVNNRNAQFGKELELLKMKAQLGMPQNPNFQAQNIQDMRALEKAQAEIGGIQQANLPYTAVHKEVQGLVPKQTVGGTPPGLTGQIQWVNKNIKDPKSRELLVGALLSGKSFNEVLGNDMEGSKLRVAEQHGKTTSENSLKITGNNDWTGLPPGEYYAPDDAKEARQSHGLVAGAIQEINEAKAMAKQFGHSWSPTLQNTIATKLTLAGAKIQGALKLGHTDKTSAEVNEMMGVPQAIDKFAIADFDKIADNMISNVKVLGKSTMQIDQFTKSQRALGSSKLPTDVAQPKTNETLE
jgi:hypothetical protein